MLQKYSFYLLARHVESVQCGNTLRFRKSGSMLGVTVGTREVPASHRITKSKK